MNPASIEFALHVIAAPYSNSNHYAALQFAEAIGHSHHRVTQVFFSGDGVYIGNKLMQPAQDVINLQQRWQALASNHQTTLTLCISACLQRGIMDAREADRYQKDHANLAEHFEISGLGQLVSAGIERHRLVTFG